MMAEPQASALAVHNPTSSAPIAAYAASQLTGRDVTALWEGSHSSWEQGILSFFVPKSSLAACNEMHQRNSLLVSVPI